MKERYTFEWDTFEVFIHNNLSLKLFCVWIFVAILEVVFLKDNGSGLTLNFPMISTVMVLPIFVALRFGHFLLFYNQAYKIIFDYKKGHIESYLLRKRKPILQELSELEHVKINWQTSLISRDGITIWYRATPEFLDFLRSKNIKRVWGSFGMMLLKKQYAKESI
jgi:hypothetical protein